MKKAKDGNLRLQDIADLAGVSLTTASMYINGKARKYKISDATCEKLEKIIREYNFNPNIHARAIAGKKTFLIGVMIVGNINKSFWLDIIAGLEEEISKYKYHAILSVSHYNCEEELESLEFIQSKGVDGYIIAPVRIEGKNNFSRIREIAREKPVITLSSPVDGLPGVYTDNFKGGALVAKHLYNNGHRKIAYIGPQSKQHTFRWNSFCAELERKNIKVSSFTNVSDFIPNAEKFTAVFCFSDYILIDLYNEAVKAGIRIPDDLSVIGYDNMDFIKYLSPLPVSVNQYKKELGTAAADELMKLLNGKEKKSNGKVFTPFITDGDSIKKLEGTKRK